MTRERNYYNASPSKKILYNITLDTRRLMNNRCNVIKYTFILLNNPQGSFIKLYIMKIRVWRQL